MLHLNPNIIGQKFTVNDPNTEYICAGYGYSGTFVIIGALNDAAKNEYTLKSFKITEVKFKSQAT